MAVVQYLYAGAGAPVAERRSGTTRAYQGDGMRSTRQLVDTTGSVTDTFAFDLFGNTRSRTGSTQTPFTWNVGSGMFQSSIGLFVRDRSQDRRSSWISGWVQDWLKDLFSGGWPIGKIESDDGSLINDETDSGGLGWIDLILGRPIVGPPITIIQTWPPPTPLPEPQPLPQPQPQPRPEPVPQPQPEPIQPPGIFGDYVRHIWILNLVGCAGCCAVELLGNISGILKLKLKLKLKSIDIKEIIGLDCAPEIEIGENPFENLPPQIERYWWIIEELGGWSIEQIQEEIIKPATECADAWLEKYLCFIKCAAQAWIGYVEDTEGYEDWRLCGLEWGLNECLGCCRRNTVDRENTIFVNRCREACKGFWLGRPGMDEQDILPENEGFGQS